MQNENTSQSGIQHTDRGKTKVKIKIKFKKKPAKTRKGRKPRNPNRRF